MTAVFLQESFREIPNWRPAPIASQKFLQGIFYNQFFTGIFLKKNVIFLEALAPGYKIPLTCDADFFNEIPQLDPSNPWLVGIFCKAFYTIIFIGGL